MFDFVLWLPSTANAGRDAAGHIQGAPSYPSAPGPSSQDLGQDRGNRGFFRGALGFVGGIARLPIVVLRTTFGVMGGVLEYGMGIASLILPQRLRGSFLV